MPKLALSMSKLVTVANFIEKKKKQKNYIGSVRFLAYPKSRLKKYRLFDCRDRRRPIDSSNRFDTMKA